MSEACEVLRDLLEDGSLPQAEVKAATDRDGISWATVRRAKDRLHIRSQKLGKPGERGEWRWMLPSEGAHEGAEDAHAQTVSTFGNVEHLREYEKPSIVARVRCESHGDAVALLRAEGARHRKALAR